MSLLAAISFFAVAAGILVAVSLYDAYDRLRWSRQEAKSREQMRRRVEQRRKDMGLL